MLVHHVLLVSRQVRLQSILRGNPSLAADTGVIQLPILGGCMVILRDFHNNNIALFGLVI